jgi:hypothetical protein
VISAMIVPSFTDVTVAFNWLRVLSSATPPSFAAALDTLHRAVGYG